MPIKDKSLYPADWPQIRKRILNRACHCCEECGVKNYSRGARDINGDWHDEMEIENMNSDVGYSYFNDFGVKCIKIVLTIAHLDHNPANNDESNLKALCQRDHLRIDAQQHKENSRITRNKNKKLQSLF